MSFSLPANLPPDVVRTYRGHRAADCWSLLASGFLSLAEAVLRRSLGASELAVTLFSVVSNAPHLLGGFWGLWMEGKPKRAIFLACGVVRFLFLGALVVSGQPAWFIGIWSVAMLMEPCFITAQSSLFQSNYPATVRGTMVSRVGAVSRFAFLVGALAGGAMLDGWPRWGSWILAGGGMLGFLGSLEYAAIPFTRPRPVPAAAESATTLLARLLGDVRRILRENPAFERYERNYMLYGLAFMMLLPVNVFLLVDAFQVSYKEFSLIKLVAVQAGFLVAVPIWGRALDRRGVYGTAAESFLLLVGYPALLSLGVWLHASWAVWAAFLLFGVCMAGVHMTWTLSSVTFARGRDSAPFMGIHLLCVGVRGVLGPFLGYGLYQWAGYHAAFGVSAALFLAAGLCMAYASDRQAVEAWKEETVAPAPAR